MKTIKTLILSLFALFSFSAMAAGASTGVISNVITVTNSPVVLVQSAGSSTGQPGCATSTSYFAIDTTTTTGASQIAWVKFANALGRTVNFSGTGACNSVVTNVENLAGLTINP